MMSKTRVLIADDNERMIQQLKNIINTEDDMEVVAEVSDGLKAVSMIEEIKPDVVLLDIVMPGLDGLGVMERVALMDKSFKHPDFIVISSIRHIEKFTDLSEIEQIDLSKLISRILSILRNHNVAEEFNIILEEKQGIHFHVWLMPRHKWMLEKFGKVLKNIKPIQEYALEYLRTEENINQIAKTCEILKRELIK